VINPKDPRGNLLKVEKQLSGHTRVVLDNGPFRTISILARTEDLSSLLDTGTEVLWEHLMTRKPGHFRKKNGKSNSTA